MIKLRIYTGLIAAAVVTFGACQLAHAYSNDAAPAPNSAATATSGASSGAATGSAAEADKAATPENPPITSQDIDASKSIGQNVAQSPSFATLYKALTATGLDASLGAGGPLVLFAPDEGAFAKIPADQLADLMKDENKAKLAKILSYHVVAGKLTYNDLDKLGATGNDIPLRTSAGATITVKKSGDKWTVTDETGAVANITVSDAKTTNGNIYVIDTVLMPKM
ncbi:MAG TPA: fasciclin domain-containing protein [Patescibacteria group bacterium]|nr:fasciclin domain-containing protein [Patescibacteria group bacterium]